jgi:hypothetical protein
LSTIRRIICRLLCYDPQPQPQPPAKEPLRSFEPGQVAILAEYPPGLELTPREIVDRVARRLAQINIDGREDVLLAPERVIILRGRQLTLATVLGDVPAARENSARLIRFISQLHQAIKKPPLETSPFGQAPGQDPQGTPEQSGEPQQPDKGTGSSPSDTGAARLAQPSTAAPAARALAPDADGFDLRAASPNWLTAGAQNIGGGGPGGWPLGATPATNPAGSQPWEFEFSPIFQAPILGARDVEVAILDTAPPIGALDLAYATWVGNDQTGVPPPPSGTLNPLLRSLLAGPSGGPYSVNIQSGVLPGAGPAPSAGPSGVLDVVYLPAISMPSDLNDFPFPIYSHGLFIAGMIRSIAPKAKLRLIQALNDKTGGTFGSIAQALESANYPGRINPLVINCSFTFHIPRPNDSLSSIPPEMLNVPQTTIDDLTQTVHDTFAVVSQLPDVLIVAASGNIGSGGLHPLARFPAALQGIAGVAALKQDDNDELTPPELTEYSNLADDQLGERFAAFGGEVTASIPPVADATKGVLGVFIEWLPIPDSSPAGYGYDTNTSGWARWAGTSFAAPIVSAILANLLSDNQPPANAVSILDQASGDIGVQNAVAAKQP